MPEQPLTCDAALDRLQDWLDGSPTRADRALPFHLNECRSCAERFAAAEVLLGIYPPHLPADFSERLSTAVRADVRQRRFRSYFVGGVTIAAALMLAVWISLPTPHTEIAQGPPVPSLDGQVANARSAMWKLTQKTLQALPDLPATDFAPGEDLGAAFEPATATLNDAGKGLREGIEPIATSAKRAAVKFWRDLPIID